MFTTHGAAARSIDRSPVRYTLNAVKRWPTSNVIIGHTINDMFSTHTSCKWCNSLFVPPHYNQAALALPCVPSQVAQLANPQPWLCFVATRWWHRFTAATPRCTVRTPSFIRSLYRRSSIHIDQSLSAQPFVCFLPSLTYPSIHPLIHSCIRSPISIFI